MRFNFSPTGTVTSEWQEIDKYHPNGHKGIDFACKEGNEIHSLTEGIVSKLTNTSNGIGLGNGIFIKTDGGYQFVYGHLSKVKVDVGDIIDKGGVIGLCGDSGRSFGSHLHLSVINSEGRYIDPQAALQHVQTLVGDLIDAATDAVSYLIF